MRNGCYKCEFFCGAYCPISETLISRRFATCASFREKKGSVASYDKETMLRAEISSVLSFFKKNKKIEERDSWYQPGHA